ncbi:hypothetical protein BC833DRAFT_252332 [Globomyces pollinis-pini]|nr:hypothetical protein BC833DRAFT_252332 [Globomyces pollinis-pini]
MEEFYQENQQDGFYVFHPNQGFHTQAPNHNEHNVNYYNPYQNYHTYSPQQQDLDDPNWNNPYHSTVDQLNGSYQPSDPTVVSYHQASYSHEHRSPPMVTQIIEDDNPYKAEAVKPSLVKPSVVKPTVKPSLAKQDPEPPTRKSVPECKFDDHPKPVVSKKRMQVKSACVNCRKSCKKCSNYRPCERCVNSGKEDSCIDVGRKPRAKGNRRRSIEQGQNPKEKEEEQACAFYLDFNLPFNENNPYQNYSTNQSPNQTLMESTLMESDHQNPYLSPSSTTTLVLPDNPYLKDSKIKTFHPSIQNLCDNKANGEPLFNRQERDALIELASISTVFSTN